MDFGMVMKNTKALGFLLSNFTFCLKVHILGVKIFNMENSQKKRAKKLTLRKEKITNLTRTIDSSNGRQICWESTATKAVTGITTIGMMSFLGKC